MDGGFANRFFFGQKVLEEERRLNDAIHSAYSGVMADEAASQVSDDFVKEFSKESTAQTLVELVGVSFFELLDIDNNLLNRHLMAYHSNKAYQMKIQQVRRQMNQ
jgi:hypothetical protein